MISRGAAVEAIDPAAPSWLHLHRGCIALTRNPDPFGAPSLRPGMSQPGGADSPQPTGPAAQELGDGPRADAEQEATPVTAGTSPGEPDTAALPPPIDGAVEHEEPTEAEPEPEVSAAAAELPPVLPAAAVDHKRAPGTEEERAARLAQMMCAPHIPPAS